MLRSVKYGLHGAVLAGLIAAPVVAMSNDKDVRLVVDGASSAVHTSAARVDQLLRAKGYQVTEHDLVAPSPSSAVHDGMKVVLRRGRLLHLEVDGRRTDVWTTAPTVSQALTQLGYATTNFVSVSRARRLPLGPTSIAIRTPRTVTLVHDGKRDEVLTTAPSVGALLSELSLTVGPKDRLSAPETAPVGDGMMLRLTRVGERTIVKLKAIPYATRQQLDSSTVFGDTSIVIPGRDGVAKVTYSVVYVDGKQVGRATVRQVVVRRPQTRVVEVGTKPVPGSPDQLRNKPSGPDASPAGAQQIARSLLAARGWADQFDCLFQMWTRESNWRYDAENPSSLSYGIPQALPAEKMAAAGPDWKTNPATQIKWGLNYIASRYGTPCGAWSFWQAHNYY